MRGMAPADYVVVGAGSAGCALAGRLTEDPDVRVTLVEAGGRGRHPNVKIPAAFAKQFRTKLDWDFATEPEPHCHGRSLFVPRGRGLGGSSAMNAMLYVRGRPLDYDLWEARGATGWGWQSVWPYFEKMLDSVRSGPERSPRPLTAEFLRSAEAAGIPYTADYNGPEQDGCALAQVTQHNGRRFSAADAYLKPARGRPNLEVVTGAHVLRVDLEGGRATGVRVRDRRGRERLLRAEREVVLSAGAIGSPQLLMLSGIGPADHLREVGVEVAADLPGVGANLHDHPYVVCVWDVPAGGSLRDAEHPRYLLEWLLRGTGPLTSSVGEAFAFVRSRPGLPAPDLQFHFAPAYFVENGFRDYDGHAITMGPVLVTPRSRGELRLRSADPAAKPRIRVNALAERDDVAALVAGVKLAREIVRCEPLASSVGRELFPGASVQSDDEIEDDLRERVELLYHPVGTCAIGSVLEPDLRVRGVEGLRVADASAMPVITGGNTNVPSMMIGERAADLVRA